MMVLWIRLTAAEFVSKMSKHGVSPREGLVTTDAKHDDQLSKVKVENEFRFQHPFTTNITGPTGCGKTYFVKTLLQNCRTKMVPPPQRIYNKDGNA
jgi:predicted AAA+ superfamily ATPase